MTPPWAAFLSADPTVQFPDASQSLNRYSYVLNNPLSFTDPTGLFSIGSIFKSIGHAFKRAFRWVSKNWRTIASIAVTAVGWQFGLTGAFIGGFTSGLIASGGDFRVGLISGITAAAFYEVGGMNFKGFNVGKFNYGKVFAHGVVGGVSQTAQGGRFGDGFLSAGFTQTVAQTGVYGRLGNPDAWGGRLAQTSAAAVTGGTAAVVGGGKFANGAVTGAFSYGFAEGFAQLEQRLAEERSLHFNSVGEMGAAMGANAYTFGGRPLEPIGGDIAIYGQSGGVLDVSNTELLHEHFFYTDENGVLHNVGFSPNGLLPDKNFPANITQFRFTQITRLSTDKFCCN